MVLSQDHRDLGSPLKSDILENVKYLATALNTADYDFVMTFLDVYPAFATTWQVLELIMET